MSKTITSTPLLKSTNTNIKLLFENSGQDVNKIACTKSSQKCNHFFGLSKVAQLVKNHSSGHPGVDGSVDHLACRLKLYFLLVVNALAYFSKKFCNSYLGPVS
jgi:hypothetical protein